MSLLSRIERVEALAARAPFWPSARWTEEERSAVARVIWRDWTPEQRAAWVLRWGLSEDDVAEFFPAPDVAAAALAAAALERLGLV